MRLFAALELPAVTRSALSSWAARTVGREPAVRLLAADALHITLVFLGSVDDAEVDAAGAALLACAREVRDLSVIGAAWLPPRRPGVLVADLTLPDALAALQRDAAA